MPAFDMNVIEAGSKNRTARSSNPGVTMLPEPSTKTAVANVQSNAAKSTTASAASTGGVTEVVRRMLVVRSIAGTVTPDADLREIGLTSLDMVDLVLSVECEFDLQIPEAQI